MIYYHFYLYKFISLLLVSDICTKVIIYFGQILYNFYWYNILLFLINIKKYLITIYDKILKSSLL